MVERATVLIVDDDPDIRDALGELLTARGYDVLSAANGREALALARTDRPAAVLLDLMMPVMDGYGFMEERAKDTTLTSIPVAIITAGTHVDRERVGKCTPVLAKPLDLRRLMDVLRGLFTAPPCPA
jgi:two-component system chemotaxis response regulator CheY